LPWKYFSARGPCRTLFSTGRAWCRRSSNASSSSSSPATIAASVTTTRKLMEQGKEEVSKVDQVVVAQLRSAIEAGAFKVDVGALADRLLSDVFSNQGEVEASDGSDP